MKIWKYDILRIFWTLLSNILETSCQNKNFPWSFLRPWHCSSTNMFNIFLSALKLHLKLKVLTSKDMIQKYKVVLRQFLLRRWFLRYCTMNPEVKRCNFCNFCLIWKQKCPCNSDPNLRKFCSWEFLVKCLQKIRCDVSFFASEIEC